MRLSGGYCGCIHGSKGFFGRGSFIGIRRFERVKILCDFHQRTVDFLVMFRCPLCVGIRFLQLLVCRLFFGGIAMGKAETGLSKRVRIPELREYGIVGFVYFDWGIILSPQPGENSECKYKRYV